MYKLGHRVTWAVLPWSVALLAWLGPHARIMHIKVSKETWADNAMPMSDSDMVHRYMHFHLA